jgi:hypothetical protein
MQRGYIKIWRKLEDSGLLQMPNTLSLFMVMLMKAVYKPCKVGMAELNRGQLSAGVYQLCEWTGLTIQNVRTSLNHLHKLNIITSKSTNKYTIYTFVNYNEYQDIDTIPNKQLTNDQQTTNKQLTTEEDIKHLSIKELTPIAQTEKVPSVHAVQFSFETGEFSNINGQMVIWEKAYPAVNIQAELNKAASWLIANPKNRKSNYARFLSNWLSRVQDKAPVSNKTERGFVC